MRRAGKVVWVWAWGEPDLRRVSVIYKILYSCVCIPWRMA